MARSLRRLTALLLVVGVGAVVFRSLRSRRAGDGDATNNPTNDPEWPPFRRAAAPTRVEATDASPDWLPPADGACPDGYAIKANDNSHIYHVPGGRFYKRTVAERCYATEAAAERDGYRRAKA